MSKAVRALLDDATMARLDRRRRLKDRFANLTIAFGGVFIIVAIALIFFYLLFESWPLFRDADFRQERTYKATQQAALWVDMDEYNQTGMRLSPEGKMTFFRVSSGEAIGEEQLPVPAGVQVTGVVRSAVLQGLAGIGLSNGQLLVIKPGYAVDSQEQGRVVTPGIGYPFGRTPLTVDDQARPLQHFAVHAGENDLKVLAGIGNQIVWQKFGQEQAEGAGLGGLGLAMEEEAPTGEGELPFVRLSSEVLTQGGAVADHVVIGQGARWAYAISPDDKLSVFRFGENGSQLYTETDLSPGPDKVTAVVALQGEISLMVGDSHGQVSQWFLVRDNKSGEERFTMQRIRSFSMGNAPVTALAAEAKRKGFVAGDAAGRVGYFYTTSGRTLAVQQAVTGPVTALSVSARSEGVFVQSAKDAAFWSLHIEHPDMSASAVWGKVWYESYPEPSYTWQSSSGNADFESKLSLVPLTFGTLKAAFYAMLLAAPLAICGAMYTAVFMSPGLRTKVKPAIELMQALPTVILGFLAGLWLAPVVENSLPGIFSLLLITPVIILLCGFLWMQIPLEKRSRIPDGWAPVLLIAPILLGGWLSFAMSSPIEQAFFGGDVRRWLETAVGLKFDQRNALIVGLVMGFAVIAPIFSIAEDALFAVPRHLTNGSLALGATQWQTLVRVVLPTASPGIFSALMIGFGRAVGETMIVLMATGNTAVMEWNIFEGMRTLSANVAVEMGEAEVGSTHFRMLFLSALVLFVITFVLNTVAEVIRARLRKKYGSL
ncbi:MAG: ABC transporter permease subunit [Fluviicoccus sp.]|uniref:ABC transporter permease subunit n=1 Tax=Fluviicoccus sp. TaxID=2003552 RepID=UPI002718E3D5|nr:ABC transporter permease subunit [Fluviicoccus sp.]MDO8329702.1 ABC transporter permease subunit [Fluviicoccus sp.]